MNRRTLFQLLGAALVVPFLPRKKAKLDRLPFQPYPKWRSLGSRSKQTTFIGSGSWDDNENWSNGLPADGDTVIIAAGKTLKSGPNQTNLNLEMLRVETGATLDILDNTCGMTLKDCYV